MGKQLYLNTAIIELLHKLPLFDMFSRDELRRVLRSGDVIRLERHQKDSVVHRGGRLQPLGVRSVARCG